MNIRSNTLKTLRDGQGLSQAELSQMTGVSISTIKRIEGANGEYEANPGVAKKLAEALEAQPEDLAADPEAKLRGSGYRPLKTVVDGGTLLAFQVVENLYGIPVRSQVLMAPLFAALLAEGSFAWRSQKVTEIADATARLRDVRKGDTGGHFLSFVASASLRLEEGMVDEEASISKRDLFGNEIGRDLGYDPSTRNPFADYLMHFLMNFVRRGGETDILLDHDSGDWKTPEGMPEYWIGWKFLQKLTGGNTWAALALTLGHVALRDIPDELLGDDAANARIDWLANQVPPGEKKKRSDDLAKL